jgi:hypothetical protein
MSAKRLLAADFSSDLRPICVRPRWLPSRSDANRTQPAGRVRVPPHPWCRAHAGELAALDGQAALAPSWPPGSLTVKATSWRGNAR